MSRSPSRLARKQLLRGRAAAAVAVGGMRGGTGVVDGSECGVARVRGLGEAATVPAAGREQC